MIAPTRLRIILAAAIVLSAMPARADTITIAESDTIGMEDAVKLGAALETMKSNIDNCLRSRQATTLHDCACKHENSIDDLEALYNRTLAIHPDWADRDISYTKGTEPPRTLPMAAISDKFDACNPDN